MNIEKINDDLMKIKRAFAAEFERALNDSYRAQLGRLKPGERAPERKRLFTEEERSSFEEKAAKYRQEAEKIITAAQEELRRSKTEAPSTEAVNAVTMLSGMKHLDAAQLEYLIERYGDNYITFKAIVDLGIQHDIYTGFENELDAIERELESQAREVGRMNLTNAESGSFSPAAFAFMEMAHRIGR